MKRTVTTGRVAVLAVGCLLGLASLATLAGCAPSPPGGAAGGGGAGGGATAGGAATRATGGGATAGGAAGGATAGGAATRATGGNSGKATMGATAGNAATPAAAGASCGETRTGANVPAVIKVAKGPVDCAAALRVEQGYAAAIRNGSLRGNGGGAPVAVDGWTCQTYPTSQVLRTGEASECHTASAEVVAELALPSSSSPAV